MEPQGLERRAARFSDRFIAYLLDVAPFAALAVGATWLLVGPLGKEPSPRLLALVGAGAITAAFAVQLLGNLSGGSPGKRIMGLRVVGRDGAPLGFGRALVRSVVWLLGHAGANAGFLVALFSRENRALHDLLAGTVVVEEYPKSRSEGALLFVAAALACAFLFAFQLWSGWNRPTAQDLEALAKARGGLAIVAEVQEAHKAKHGAYAATLEQLADASGDPRVFVDALAAIYQPELSIEGGNRAWRVRVRAKDRKKTLLVATGP